MLVIMTSVQQVQIEMHVCGVWMVRKQNISDSKAKGIRE